MISAPREMRCRSIAGHFHDREHDGERQRDRKRDDGAGPNAETDKAHRHDDGDGLPQRRREVANGVIDDKRLIGHEDRLDAQRQIGPDLAHGLLDIPAEGQNIAAFAHRDGNADGRFSVDPEHRLRRIRIVAVNLGDVAQPDQTAVRDEIHRQDDPARIRMPPIRAG